MNLTINENDLAEKLINLRGFKTNVHNISNSLPQVTDLEAQSLLLDELLNHRLKNATPEQLEELIDTKDKKFLWSITYAQKDIVRKQLRQQRHDQEAKDKMKVLTESTYIIDLDKSSKLSESEIQKIINLLPKLFYTTKRQTFIATVLLFGKETTKEKLDLTEKQFNRRVEDIEDYCKKHRGEFINILTSPYDRKLMKEQKLLDKLLNAKDDAETQDLFNTYNSEVNDLVGQASNPYIPMQGKFINDYHHAPQSSKDIFKQYLISKDKEIERRLA